MKRKIFYVVVLSMFWIPFSASGQLNKGEGSGFQTIETHAMKDQTANQKNHLNDLNGGKGVITDELIPATELEQRSDSVQAKKGEKEEKRDPGQIALMIITLMVAIVVFISTVGDQ